MLRLKARTTTPDLSFYFVAGSHSVAQASLELPDLSLSVVSIAGLYHQRLCSVYLGSRGLKFKSSCTSGQHPEPSVALSGGLYVSGDGGEKDISPQGQGQALYP